MAKRDRNSNIWKDPFYRNLPPLYKCLWDYIKDDCDNAGVWIPDFKVASICIGRKVKEETARELFAGKIFIMDSGNWLLPTFITDVLGFADLNEKDRFQKSIIELLSKHFLEINKGLVRTLQGPIIRTGERIKDKDKEGVQGENLESNLSRAFDEIYIEGLKLSRAYPTINIDKELTQFLVKVRGAPDTYDRHDTNGLRSAFNYQLRHAKPEQKHGLAKVLDQTARRNQLIEAKFAAKTLPDAL